MIELYTSNPAVQAVVNIGIIGGALAIITVVVMGPRRAGSSMQHPLFGRYTIHVPNLMSLLRFPIALWILAVHMLPNPVSPLWSLSLHLSFWVVCLFDLLDGKFARKWEAITEDGKSLDPAADKFVTFALAIAAWRYGQLPLWAVTIVFSREIISVIQRSIMQRRGRDVSAGWLGKIKTGVQFTVLYILILRIDHLPGTVGLDSLTLLLSPGSVMWAVILLCFITVISLFPFFETFFYVNNYRKSQRVETEKPWSVVAIPNLFTIGNYLCGVTAVYFAMPDVDVLYRPFVILFWVMAGALLDALDGPVARRLGVHSEFGSCLDSSTDLSTFGLAVATIVFLVFASMDSVPVIGALALAGFYFGSVHLRLARFSKAKEQKPDFNIKENFVGLPSPSGALGVLVLLTLVHDLKHMQLLDILVLTLLIGGTSILMYSNYDFISHANAIHKPFYRLVMIPVLCVGFGMLLVLNFQQPFVTNHFSRELIYYFRGCSWILATTLVIYIIDGIRRGPVKRAVPA